MIKNKNLMESLLDEITRVTEIRQQYLSSELNGAGTFTATLMEQDIQVAKESISKDDVVEMINVHEKLKSWEL